MLAVIVFAGQVAKGIEEMKELRALRVEQAVKEGRKAFKRYKQETQAIASEYKIRPDFLREIITGEK